MKLISIDVLITEIDKLVDKGKYHEGYDCGFRDGNNYILNILKEKINTLEVKNVDLEKKIDDWYNTMGIPVTTDALKETARYFFELGLKIQKGE